MTQHATSPESWIADRLAEPQAKFGAFGRTVYGTGSLDLKTKELIAVAASSVGRCPHCTDGHLARAKEVGASEEEVGEALAVAWVLGGATQVAWMEEDLERYLGEAWRARLVPEVDRSFQTFEAEVFEAGTLDRKTKELIALAVSCMLRCRRSTRSHIEAALEAGATKSEVAEAITVLWVIGSGVQIVWNRDGFEEHLRNRPQAG